MDKITRKLPIGMEISGVVHKDFDIRQPLVSDMVEAETDADPRQIHAFNVELLARVVTRVGTFNGPFTPNMFLKLKRSDYNTFISAMLEADKLGEEVSGAAEISTDAS